LAVQKEKYKRWKAGYWLFRKKKLDAGKLGIDSSERRKLDGSWVLAVQKEKTRCWGACH
jgi:hypothetical protein